MLVNTSESKQETITIIKGRIKAMESKSKNIQSFTDLSEWIANKFR